MSITHQSLKELAQRPDEEVVQLWLEQRGLTTQVVPEFPEIPILYTLPNGTVHKVQDKALFNALMGDINSLQKQLAEAQKQPVAAVWHRKVDEGHSTKPAHIPPPGQSAPADRSTQQPGVSPYITQPSMHPIWPNKELEQFARIDAVNKYAVILEEFPKLSLKINDLQIAQIKNHEVSWQAQHSIKQELVQITIRLERVEKLLRHLVPDRSNDV